VFSTAQTVVFDWLILLGTVRQAEPVRASDAKKVCDVGEGVESGNHSGWTERTGPRRAERPARRATAPAGTSEETKRGEAAQSPESKEGRAAGAARAAARAETPDTAAAARTDSSARAPSGAVPAASGSAAASRTTASAQLQQEKRSAQYRSEQQYLARLRQQQVRIESQGRYNYSGDPYFYTPSSYRYSRGGRDYETNQYGVDLLRRAVNYGYDEGRRAGLADRQDRWASNYQEPYAYQDATYGYSGFYVDRDEYNNYFREGFRRGYEDGHNAGSRYGSYANGKSTILGAVLAAILNFQSMR
jgi:hypothetical protein